MNKEKLEQAKKTAQIRANYNQEPFKVIQIGNYFAAYRLNKEAIGKKPVEIVYPQNPNIDNKLDLNDSEYRENAERPN